MGRTYSARVVNFRRSVYANRGKVTPGCQVLLLRLSEDMNANAIVSIPRSRLAEEFHCDPSRITEWMNQARAAGFLSIVRRARPGVTATYQGHVKVRSGAPLLEVRNYAPIEVRESAPLSGAEGCALTPTQEVVPTAAIGAAVSDRLEQRGQDEEQSVQAARALNERSA